MDRRSFLGILGGIFTGACLPKIVGVRPVLVPGVDSLQALALRNFDRAWEDLRRVCDDYAVTVCRGGYSAGDFHIPQKVTALRNFEQTWMDLARPDES